LNPKNGIGSLEEASYIDSPGPVRPGEELDRARLLPYLRKTLGCREEEVEILQFPGGHSNLTYLVRAGGRELVLRRPPFGARIRSAHDMAREYRVLTKLAPVYGRVPKPVAMCEDETVLGCKFYLTERIRGVILRSEPPAGLGLDAHTVRKLCASFVDTLVELHAIDFEAAGLGELGRPQGYVERQVEGWSRRYRDAKTDEIPEIEEVERWLRAHLPRSGPPSLIHNDYKYDNLVLDPKDLSSIVGILDWEMCTVGDPLMDLGTALCYWVEEEDPELVKMIKVCPTTLPGSFKRREIAERYAAKSGRDLSEIAFYYCFGLFKTAVVGQQLYARYKRGLTHDERFANLIHGVRIIAQQAVGFLGRASL